MLLADAFNGGGLADEQLSQFLTTFGRHNRPVVQLNLRGLRDGVDTTPSSLKGWVVSLHRAHKKAEVLQAPAQVVF